MSSHRPWRDCQAWRDEGLPWSSTSNEAVKLYDAALTQVMTYHEDPAFGGLRKTFENMLGADPNFVMGHILATGMMLTGSELPNPHINQETRSKIDNIISLAAVQKLSDHECKHVAAIEKLAEGRCSEACQIYEEILLSHPQDVAASRLAFFTYFFAGEQAALRDSLARVIPRCKPSMPLYGCLLGMWAFGNVETNMFATGERLARQALGLNQFDSWSTHTLAHALDHTCRPDEGISFLTSTRADWELRSHLACHNNWHLALFHIENGNHESALDVYDQKLEAHDSSMFNIVDRGSLLRRLELQGVDVGGRWADVYELGRPYLGDHSSVFQQFHALLTCLGSKHITEAKQCLNDIKDTISQLPIHSYYRQTTEAIGIQLYQGLIAYEEEDFPAAVNLLRPLKYQTVKIGGSNAQRDVMDLILIDAALRSQDPQHTHLSKALLYERKALRGNCYMTDALMAKMMAKHDHS